MDRRTFLQQIGAGLAAGALGWSGHAGPLWARSWYGGSGLRGRVALLADAHLDASPRGEYAAHHLWAAVTAINALQPPVDLVFFLGDLSHAGDVQGFARGWDILAKLAAPCWLLPGEHEPSGWFQGDDRLGNFSFSWQGIHFLGVNTANPGFADLEARFGLTPPRLAWLAGELAQVPPEQPLIILSHAPLYPLFRPWHWWTAGATGLTARLAGRLQVLLLHGHVHQYLGSQMGNLLFQGVRATSWPLPDVHMGTPATCPEPHEKPGRAGCGWLLLDISSQGTFALTDQVWTA